MATREEPSTGRVMAVDDMAEFRLLLRRVVEATPGFEVVADVDSGEQAVATAKELCPDLVLMDVEMPGCGGLEATRSIKADRPCTFVILVSATHPDDLPPGAASCGADAIVWKPKLRPALLAEIWRDHRAMSGAT